MTVVTKLSISLLGAGGVAGGGIGIYKMYDKGTVENDVKIKRKISDRLKNSLLKTSGTDDDVIWEKRRESLKTVSQGDVVSYLWDIKDSPDAKNRLKSWCASEGSEEYLEESAVVNNVKKYCTYNMKDKLSKAIEVQSGNWQTISNTLKGKGESDALSTEMKRIRDALNGGGGSAADEHALKNWCSNVYETMYEDNQDFKDASVYCVADSAVG